MVKQMTADEFTAYLRENARVVKRYKGTDWKRISDALTEAADRLDAYRAIGISLMRTKPPSSPAI